MACRWRVFIFWRINLNFPKAETTFWSWINSPKIFLRRKVWWMLEIGRRLTAICTSPSQEVTHALLSEQKKQCHQNLVSFYLVKTRLVKSRFCLRKESSSISKIAVITSKNHNCTRKKKRFKTNSISLKREWCSTSKKTCRK